MDYAIRWSPDAVEDIEEIAAYIRKDSPLYAQQVVEELIKASRRLTRFPGSRGQSELPPLLQTPD